MKTDNFCMTFEFGSEGPAGPAGKNLELQLANGYLQWRVIGDTDWNNLLNISVITGPKGEKGDAGPAPEFRFSNDYLQWRAPGAEEWANLMPVSVITGPRGAPGQSSVIEFPSFSTFEELAAAYPTGDGPKIHLISAQNYLYKWNEAASNWEALGKLGSLPQNLDETIDERVNIEKARAMAVEAAKEDVANKDNIMPDNPQPGHYISTKAAQDYTNQKVAAAVTSQYLKAFWFGKTKSETAAPLPQTEDQSYFDFTTDSIYTAKSDLTGWLKETSITKINGTEIGISSAFWDITEAGNPGYAKWSESTGKWDFYPNLSFRIDGTTLNSRISDGAIQIAPQTITEITEDAGKFIAGGETPFKTLVQTLYNKTNGIITALGDKLAISAKGAANGVASLDANAKVPLEQLPTEIVTLQSEMADIKGGVGFTSTGRNELKLLVGAMEIESAEMAAAAGQHIFTHGLDLNTYKITSFDVFLRCISADIGYLPGDEVKIWTNFYNGTYAMAQQVTKDDTNGQISCSDTAGTLAYLRNKTTGAAAAGNVANWRLVFKITYGYK